MPQSSVSQGPAWTLPYLLKLPFMPAMLLHLLETKSRTQKFVSHLTFQIYIWFCGVLLGWI